MNFIVFVYKNAQLSLFLRQTLVHDEINLLHYDHEAGM